MRHGSLRRGYLHQQDVDHIKRNLSLFFDVTCRPRWMCWFGHAFSGWVLFPEGRPYWEFRACACGAVQERRPQRVPFLPPFMRSDWREPAMPNNKPGNAWHRT